MNAQHVKNSGQATIEIMIILPLLLVLLAVSISIFSQQLLVADSIRSQQAVERSAEIVANGLMEMSRAPIESSMRVYVPKGPDTQTIALSNGLIEAYSSFGYASVKLPYTEWNAPLIQDGNSILISRDSNGLVRVRVV